MALSETAIKIAVVFAFISVCSPFSNWLIGPVKAQDAAAQANNPLADVRAFNIQNYYTPSFTGSGAFPANTSWLRYAQPVGTPVGNFLVRASLPFRSVKSSAVSRTFGMGDFNIFAAYSLDTGAPGVTAGVGPLLVVPTATEDVTGTGKWQAGAAAVYFNAKSKTFQWGGLLTWQTAFAGPKGRDHTNIIAAQPFGFLQLGDGLYTGMAPTWAFDIQNDRYNVPLGLRLGKVFKRGKTVFNFFVEPQYSVLTKGAGQPEFQIYMALNMQFY
ncbi:MAG: hypothetical protein ABJQ21_08635 [Roseibium sp.]